MASAPRIIAVSCLAVSLLNIAGHLSGSISERSVDLLVQIGSLGVTVILIGFMLRSIFAPLVLSRLTPELVVLHRPIRHLEDVAKVETPVRDHVGESDLTEQALRVIERQHAHGGAKTDSRFSSEPDGANK